MDTRMFLIDIEQIREIYNDYYVDYPEYLNEDKFQEFLRFLEIDFYDWVRENMKQYLLLN